MSFKRAAYVCAPNIYWIVAYGPCRCYKQQSAGVRWWFWHYINTWNLCVYACSYVWCVCTYVCMYVRMHVCSYYVCRYVCMHVCSYVYVCMYVCSYVCTYVCVWVWVSEWIKEWMCITDYFGLNICKCVHLRLCVLMYVCINERKHNGTLYNFYSSPNISRMQSR
jgi:hypothetical protein